MMTQDLEQQNDDQMEHHDENYRQTSQIRSQARKIGKLGGQDSGIAQSGCPETIKRQEVHKILDDGFKKISHSQHLRKLVNEQNAMFSHSMDGDSNSSEEMNSEQKLRRL